MDLFTPYKRIEYLLDTLILTTGRIEKFLNGEISEDELRDVIRDTKETIKKYATVDG